MKTPFALRTLFAASCIALAAASASADIIMPKPPAPPQASVDGYAHGKILRVDESKKSITLKHGAIESLNMPPMTMAYLVASDELFSRLKAGDAILFKAEERAGKYVIVEAKPDSAPKAP